MAGREYPLERTRNIGIMAHIDVTGHLKKKVSQIRHSQSTVSILLILLVTLISQLKLSVHLEYLMVL